ncbi:hypothetical protein LB504_009815 [Fusarium proliferatum]|nr:hypothetical protein LB504_009815 [Fusarium proliferatum]
MASAKTRCSERGKPSPLFSTNGKPFSIAYDSQLEPSIGPLQLVNCNQQTTMSQTQLHSPNFMQLKLDISQLSYH